MKKIVSLVLCLMLLLGTVSALADIDITTEEVTLRYAVKGEDFDLTQKLVDNFMLQYPNIKVELLEMDPSTYNNGIGNMASEQNLPDLFWYESVVDAVANDWAMRLDTYFENDADAALFEDSVMKHTSIGGRHYSIPMISEPNFVLVNKTLFDRYNVELPAYDWTYEEFCNLAETLTHPEDHVFGLNSLQTGTFWIDYGWDGESYTFSDLWVELEEQARDWKASGVTDNLTGDEKAALFGDANVNLVDNGNVAMAVLPNVWAAAYLDGSVEAATGVEFLYYPIPCPNGTTASTLQCAVISKSCQHPNEAWLLAKWVGWSKEAFSVRLDYYQENEIKKMIAPMIKDDALWTELKAKCDPALVNYYTYMLPVIPQLGAHAPGNLSCSIDYFFGGASNKLNSGELSPADAALELRTKYNKIRDDWFLACAEFEGYTTATDLDVAVE